MQNNFETAISFLKKGKSPGNSQLLAELTVGVNYLSDFWVEKYLKEYIGQGGSKIKFVTGNSGSGKTHFLELFMSEASDNNYITVSFSAKDIWVHDFKDIYLEILEMSNILECLKKCGDKIIRDLGFNPEEIPENMSFVDYLSSKNMMDAITKREIRFLLNKTFLQSPLIDNNFALCCSFITGGILGHPTLEDQNRDILLGWLSGNKEVSLATVRRLGISPSRITKYNARHMLRSLVEVVKIAGYSGLIVAIDDLENLINVNSLEEIRYTKLRREDAYESIRELIDEIDTLKNIMFVFSFDRSLIDNDMKGFKSYQALWMRIQNEIDSERFNRFTDIVDLDKLAMQEYNIKVILEMSQKLAKVLNVSPIDEDCAQELIARTNFGQVSLPRQVNIATIGGSSR